MRPWQRRNKRKPPSFNPRICKRCDWFTGRTVTDGRGFNPRICKRCDFKQLGTVPPNGGFNPRICKRCDISSSIFRVSDNVSIHASVKDATKQIANITTYMRVSIHASVKDATLVFVRRVVNVRVSIHASVKDATLFPYPIPLFACFNPRICKRCDFGYFFIS